ncbi:MAG: hypothetical protein OES09_14645 [Gammaproteobacteria bacterium]|nr:hypothetical protein [Gammaproteobacteria bacterium]
MLGSCIGTLGVLVLAALPAIAQTSKTDSRDILLDPFETQPQFLSAERYTEGWDQYFYFDDGSLLSTHFLVTNLGIGDHRGLVVGTLVRTDGTTLTIKNGRARRDWSHATDQLDMRIASHELAQRPGHYRLYLNNASGEIEVNFRAISEPWRIGRTWEDASRGHYQSVSVYAPMANAEGRFRLGPRSGGDPVNEPWSTLGAGRGFGLRYANSVALASIATDWLRVFPLGSEQTLAPALNAISKTDGGRGAQFAIVNPKDGRLRQADTVVVEYESIEIARHRGRIHEVPAKLSVRGRGSGFSVSGTIVPVRFLHKFDLVKELKPIERFIVQFMTTPVHFRYLADYDIDFTSDGSTSRLTGKALVEFLSLKSRTAE